MRNLLMLFFVGLFFLSFGIISQEANASIKSSAIGSVKASTSKSSIEVARKKPGKQLGAIPRQIQSAHDIYRYNFVIEHS